MKTSVAWLGLPLCAWLACGNDGIKAPPCVSPAMASLDDSNTVAIAVDRGPAAAAHAYTDGAFASVTLCVPGSTTACQTIDHLLVDTGSMGVRVLESLLTVPLPSVSNSAGLPVAECTQFVDGAAWGPVKVADVQIGQEVAHGISIQAIGDELTFTQVPTSCDGTAINTLDDLGSNGILGVGVLAQDCGPICATRNVGQYYGCGSATNCTATTVPLEQQVINPVAAFPVDNNGVILQLPCIAPQGAAEVDGVMVFGIGTQANNGLGSAKVMALDMQGFVTTAFPEGGRGYNSFLDSGSNALFFLNASTSGVRQCTASGLVDFYCPPSLTNLTAAISSGSESYPLVFSVANTATLPAASNAFNDLAGPMPGYPLDTTIPAFDWGLPFYFGRSVYTAIDGRATPGANGPYFAF